MQTNPKKTKTELPFHGAAPDARPADAFMAEQAAMVNPRRAAFSRLGLMPEHDALLPDALRAARDAERAEGAAKPAPGVRLDDERPVPEFSVPPLPRPGTAKRDLDPANAEADGA